MSDLSSVVLVLEGIYKELSWWEKSSSAAKMLKELERVNLNLEHMDRRLKDIESELARK